MKRIHIYIFAIATFKSKNNCVLCRFVGRHLVFLHLNRVYCSQVVLLCMIAGACCQEAHYQSPHKAAILSDTRYLAGDGTFGAAYSQEDGVVFKEESDVNGDRRGSYSYVDPTGQRRTVTYTAGKNGFQVRGMCNLAEIVSYQRCRSQKINSNT